ncbi:hypothetical protein BDV28DRAFT_144735 [Aspergillus coremiiformis]|uniref:Uncharacterized protein n=1 Tax=Aspergillus coremiiformis TaxID=138285 RepID=A0A5N6ZJ53_9EURO|nr:hypothetical protein BDV28DRAFT_144735 [Aspergillus coremiiformis]
MSVITYPDETSGGTVTSYLPPTPPWPSNPRCSDIFHSYNNIPLVAFDALDDQKYGSRVNCIPAEAKLWAKQPLRKDYTLYQLGPFSCPTHFPVVSTLVQDLSSTLSICCPSGYEFQTNAAATDPCLSAVQSGATLTYTYLVSNGYIQATTTIKGVSNVAAFPIRGWNIDLPGPSTVYTSSGATVTVTGIFTPTSSELPHSPDQPNQGNGMSTGAKAGLGVGISLIAFRSGYGCALSPTKAACKGQ